MAKKPATSGKIYVAGMYGLGGAIWSGGMETILAANIRKQIPGVICPPTRLHTQWSSIVEEIKALPKGTPTVVYGHSMGAISATKVTDYVYVDLLVLYDLAGGAPSKLGRNTGRCIDIYDTIPDLVPEWRVEPIKGFEDRIERWTTRYGHTGVDDSTVVMQKVVDQIKLIAPKE